MSAINTKQERETLHIQLLLQQQQQRFNTISGLLLFTSLLAIPFFLPQVYIFCLLSQMPNVHTITTCFVCASFKPKKKNTSKKIVLNTTTTTKQTGVVLNEKGSDMYPA